MSTELRDAIAGAVHRHALAETIPHLRGKPTQDVCFETADAILALPQLAAALAAERERKQSLLHTTKRRR